MKKCKKCFKEKNLDDFNFKKSSKDGYRNECKDCIKLYKKQYNIKNKDKISLTNKEYYEKNITFFKEVNKQYREKNKENIKMYRENNKEDMKNYMKNYRKKNKNKLLIKRKEYLKNNPEMKKKFLNNKYHNMSPLQKLKVRLRNKIYKILKKKGYIKKEKSNDIYGCTYDFLIKYLESKFEIWMDWSNYGLCNGEYNYGWDIDHIIPLASAKDELELLNLCHYTNLQPLCSKVNRFEKRDN